MERLGKIMIHILWADVIGNMNVGLAEYSIDLFMSVFRDMFCYRSKVREYGNFTRTYTLMGYFLKKVMRLLPTTPVYPIAVAIKEGVPFLPLALIKDMLKLVI